MWLSPTGIQVLGRRGFTVPMNDNGQWCILVAGAYIAPRVDHLFHVFAFHAIMLTCVHALYVIHHNSFALTPPCLFLVVCIFNDL